MLWLYKRVIFGKVVNEKLFKISDVNKHEVFILATLAVPSIFFGFYPDPLINTIQVSLDDIIDIYNTNVSLNIVE